MVGAEGKQDQLRTYHSPWMVHLSVGPVGGLVSQNCVCRKRPPGAAKQQVSATSDTLWQLSSLGCGQEAGWLKRMMSGCGARMATCAHFARDQRDGKL
jgi:hypothetical protein